MPSLQELATRLRSAALAYPAAREDHPWGYTAFKIGKKPFALLACEPGEVRLLVRLPASVGDALLLPFTRPAPLGLAGRGWIEASVTNEDVDMALLLAWLEESFRAAAPKELAVRMTLEHRVERNDRRSLK